MNTILFISTSILAFSGFFIAFYGLLSQSLIEAETKLGMQKGFNSYSNEGAEYFAKRYNKWRVGSFFLTNDALILGLILVASAIILNFIENSWWSSLIVLFIGYFLYLILAKIFSWKLQLISFILAICSLCYSTYLIT